MFNSEPQVDKTMARSLTFLIVAALGLLLVAPSFGVSTGPPWENNNRMIIEEGCFCHGVGGGPSSNGTPTSQITISISGVPRSYSADENYQFTINLDHESNSIGGFMLWDEGMGTLEPGEGSIVVVDSGGALSQGTPGNDWIVNWTAPENNDSDVHFTLIGNIVDEDGTFSDGDAWNMFTFTVFAPGNVTNDDDPGLRTISAGDYDRLFGQKSADELEVEHQANLAEMYFTQGNLYFWTTLCILIGAAVLQGEFYERRFSGGPPHLDISLAIPQGITRGVVASGLLILLGWGIDSNLPWGYNLLIGMGFLWAGFGVYRTVVQARAPKEQTDLV